MTAVDSETRAQATGHERSGSTPPHALYDVTLHGRKLRYVDFGPREAPAILFLHGVGRDHRQWSRLARALSTDRRVVAPDLPGFGASEPLPNTASFESFAETAIDLVATLKLGRVTVVGQGTGGAIALVAASDRPEFVERLVVIAPPCYRAPASFAERLVDAPVVGATLFRRILGPQLLARHGGLDALPSPAAFHLLRAARRPATIEARLPRVRAGALVVWGREDGVLPWTHGTRLAREIGGARLEILDCGHFPEDERPETLESLVRELAIGEARPSRSARRPAVR